MTSRTALLTCPLLFASTPGPAHSVAQVDASKSNLLLDVPGGLPAPTEQASTLLLLKPLDKSAAAAEPATPLSTDDDKQADAAEDDADAPPVAASVLTTGLRDLSYRPPDRQPVPCTLHPAPCTLHPIPRTLHCCPLDRASAGSPPTPLVLPTHPSVDRLQLCAAAKGSRCPWCCSWRAVPSPTQYSQTTHKPLVPAPCCSGLLVRVPFRQGHKGRNGGGVCLLGGRAASIQPAGQASLAPP